MFRILKLCAEAILVLGALACIFQFIVQFFDLKPKDIQMHIGWPAWAWLICGLLLFGISLWSSGYSLYLHKRGASEREKKLTAEIEAITENHKAEMKRQENNLDAQIASKDAFVADASAEARTLKKQLSEKCAEIELLRPVMADGVAVIGQAADFMRQRAKWKPNPDDTNLSGEILEMLYQPEFSGFGFTGFDILLRVRLTNFGNNPATITHYRLGVEIGRDGWHGEQSDIPAAWVLEREGPLNLLGKSATIAESIAPLNSSSDPLLKGIPQTGWLMFKMSQGWVPGFKFPVGAQITLIVTDSYGMDHLIIKPCGKYATTTKVTNAKN